MVYEMQMFAPTEASEMASSNRTEISVMDSFLLEKVAPTLEEASRCLMPVNLEEEKEKTIRLFNRGNVYNPVFRYKSLPPDLDDIASILASYKFGSTDIDSLYRELTREYLRFIEMYRSIGTNEFTKNSLSLFPRPNLSSISLARRFLRLRSERTASNRTVPASYVAFALEGALRKRKLDEWRVVVTDDMLANASVSTIEKVIRIRKSALFSSEQIKRLEVHEVDTHVLRYENGCRQPFAIFKLGTAGYATTEEGLAVLAEIVSECISVEIMSVYAARLLAVDRSIVWPFYRVMVEVFSLLGDIEQSFDVTARAKRGITETESHGAYTKESVYWLGLEAVKKFLSRDGELKELFVGKVGINDIAIMRRLLERNAIFIGKTIPELFRMEKKKPIIEEVNRCLGIS